MTKVHKNPAPKPKRKAGPQPGSHPARQAATGKAAAGALRKGNRHRVRIEEIHSADLGQFEEIREAASRRFHGAARATDPISILEATPSGPRILEILDSVFPRQDAMLEWLNHPHPDLAGRTPMQVVEMGYAGAVEGMLEAALLGLPS